jgi:membrane-bound inhibitor of C-type lysozyme
MHGALKMAAAVAAAVDDGTATVLAIEYEARMRSDEMAMRFSCRQHAMQIRRLDSRVWQNCAALAAGAAPPADPAEIGLSER